MRSIAIIGSGQAGVLAAHGLLRAGHDVALYSDRSPEDWLERSRPTGTARAPAPLMAQAVTGKHSPLAPARTG